MSRSPKGMFPVTRKEERELVARFYGGSSLTEEKCSRIRKEMLCPSVCRGLNLTESDCPTRFRNEMLHLPFPDPRKRAGSHSRLRREIAYAVSGGILGAILGQVVIWLVFR